MGATVMRTSANGSGGSDGMAMRAVGRVVCNGLHLAPEHGFHNKRAGACD